MRLDGEDDPLEDPLNRLELEKIVSEAEGRPLRIDPNHPKMVQDEYGGWWDSSITEEERQELRQQLRELFRQDAEDD